MPHDLAASIEDLAREVADVLPPSELPPAFEASRARGVFSSATLALHCDALRVGVRAADLDGQRTEDELAFLLPVALRAARLLASARPDAYGAFASLPRGRVWSFLDQHATDPGLFGGDASSWPSLAVLLAMSRRGYPSTLRRWKTLLTDLVRDTASLRGAQHREDQLRELLHWVADQTEVEGTVPDPQLRAFCDRSGPSVFSSTARTQDVFARDPYDVEDVHPRAREVFGRLLERAGRDNDGRILVLLGQSGAGKTHLLRAFRSQVHGTGRGYAGYVQLTSFTGDYPRYILRAVLDSLEQPYDAPGVEESGLQQLSGALANLCAHSKMPAIESMPGLDEPTKIVNAMVDGLLRAPGMRHFDADVLRAFLYLQRDDPAIQNRAIKFLRCEAMTDHDRSLLGNMSPPTSDHAALRTLATIAKLIEVATSGALVILVDQLEDITHGTTDPARSRFPELVDALRHVTEQVPSAVVVMASLADAYHTLLPGLTHSARDRLQLDPPPNQIRGNRNPEEIRKLVARRLAVLFESMGAQPRHDDPVYPIRSSDLQALANMRTRDVLAWCRATQEASMEVGVYTTASSAHRSPLDAPAPAPSASVQNDLDARWTQFRSDHEVPSDDVDRRGLLEHAIAAAAAERRLPIEIASRPQHLELRLRDHTLIVGLLEGSANGGGLERPLDQLLQIAGRCPVALVRTDAFPSPTSKIGRRLGGIVADGGRMVSVSHAQWRTMHAARAFYSAHADHPRLDGWSAEEQPFASLPALEALLEIGGPTEHEPLRTPRPRHPATAPPAGARDAAARPRPAPVASAPKPPGIADSPGSTVRVGQAKGLRGGDVELELDALCKHVAFLGGTGSGKTTLALNLVEKALARGVSVVFLDRKGDLGRYADPAWWDGAASSANGAALKQHLRANVEVTLYTPGKSTGAPLGLPLLPRLDAGGSELERRKAAQQAAAALAPMLRYKASRKTDNTRLGILANAIALLCELESEPTLADLVEFIDGPDPALASRMGRFNKTHFSALVESLELIRMGRVELFDPSAEPLDIGRLLGREAGAAPRTRLSIITTKFLDDASAQEYWVARMLAEVTRWGSKHPQDRLQGLFFFDEADVYMPASTKPATKEPLQDLLKRGRSAGLGVLLATQSPGDLDYRSRENVGAWFIGRVGADTALKKLAPLLADTNVAPSTIAGQRVGEFTLLRSGTATQMSGARSLMETAQLSEAEILALTR